MFDIGFWELLLILVVALLVIGPERLPRAARTAGQWFSRMRSFVQVMRSEVDRQIEAAELREAARETRETLDEATRDEPSERRE